MKDWPKTNQLPDMHTIHTYIKEEDENVNKFDVVDYRPCDRSNADL